MGSSDGQAPLRWSSLLQLFPSKSSSVLLPPRAAPSSEPPERVTEEHVRRNISSSLSHELRRRHADKPRNPCRGGKGE